jgi:anti-anti-sigma regulatory factor
MHEGHIYVAQHHDWLVLRFTGPIRFTMGGAARPTAALDAFLDGKFRAPDFKNVLIDLSETETIDSTNLGLLAKIAGFASEHLGTKPVIITPQPDIFKLLTSLAFDKVFHLVANHEAPVADMQELTAPRANTKSDRCLVLEAHRALAALSPENKDMFRDVIRLMDDPSAEPPPPR